MLEEMSCDKVYTLCFWGVSQFIDVVQWQFKGLVPGLRMDANNLCGTPPVYVVMYGLRGQAALDSNGDPVQRKHYNSLKDYYFKVALWSTAALPDAELLRRLLGDRAIEAEAAASAG